MSPTTLARLIRALLPLAFVSLLHGPAAFAACVPGNCNDGNACTTDTCDTDTGACVYANNTGSCNDVNACTVGDTCSDGVCQGTPITCNDSNACTDDACNPVVGCIFTKDDTNACQDASACTTGDHCSNGACVGTPIVCPDDSDVCTTPICNPVTGCGFVGNTAACDDGDGCTLNDQCAGGTCTPGSAKNCSDGNACTTDSCDPTSGLCGYENNTAACDDGDVCTVGDTCDGGSCAPGDPLACDDANACTDDTCNPISGCAYAPDDTNPCSDDTVCTVADHCVSGLCLGQTVSCPDDGNVCTDAICDPATGCAEVSNASPCDDGDACTVNDACAAGTCHAGTPKSCDDGEVCTTDTCDPANGSCGHADNTLACSDGDVCTIGDACAGGTCQSGPRDACDDGNPCTADGCAAPAGCVHAFDDTATCSDANLCTTNDHCADGACVGDAASCPDDGDVCTDAVCDPATGCGVSYNTASCDDGDACTTADHCVAGTCVGTTDVCASCPALPTDGCVAARPQGSTLALKDAVKAKRDALAWKWRSATVMTPGDLGDPTTDAGLRLCVYDLTAGVAALALSVELPPGGSCGRRPCWKRTKAGVAYKRPAKDDEGGAAFRFDAKATKSGFALTASGPELAMPALPLQKDPRVIVELHRTDVPICWAARYATSKRPKPGVFKAVSE